MSSSMQFHPSVADPFQWSNLPRWVRRTIAADRREYQRQFRPLTIQRVGRLVIPNMRRPIFIVGAPRSGTTFLGACLGELPEISYHFEPVATKAATRLIYENCWSTLKARWFFRTVYAWLMRLHLDGDLRFAEKTPQISFIIPFLVRAFPDAQFIHILRDGRDAALSYSKKPWLQAAQAQSGKAEPGGYAYGPYARFWVESERVKEFETTSDLHRCIWGWRRFTESVLAAAAQLPTGQYHELRYESLVSNPTLEADRLLDFLQISNSKSRSVFHGAIAQARPDSVGQYRRELLESQLQEIDREAGTLLRRLGYVH